jgi:hypothetical protein
MASILRISGFTGEPVARAPSLLHTFLPQQSGFLMRTPDKTRASGKAWDFTVRGVNEVLWGATGGRSRWTSRG